MKILFAIQATGNGHLSRAREIVPKLTGYGELDLLVSGTQADVILPYLIKYKKKGLSYTFGSKGNIDLVDTIKRFRPIRLMHDMVSFPVNKYDIIINDFEPITAWACKFKSKNCTALSHQAAFLSKLTPRPSTINYAAECILKYYAPVSDYYGLHFKAFDDKIYTPVIRSEVRQLEPSLGNHYTVYLPAHGHHFLIEFLKKFKTISWEVFSKQVKCEELHQNVKVMPIQNQSFLKSLSASKGLITAGGFESVAEALFLNKKVLVVPMSNQYEQLCNAQAALQVGVKVIPKLSSLFINEINTWLASELTVRVNYPDLTDIILQKIIHSTSL